MISLKSDTYSGETYIYIFSFANNTLHFFPLFFASKPKKQQMERKKDSF